MIGRDLAYLKYLVPFYLVGGAVFVVSLLLTWVLTYLVVLQNDEKKIWHAFERYERTGTRVMVIVFQVVPVVGGIFLTA